METFTILDSDSDLDHICRLCLAPNKKLCKIFETDTEPSEWTVADKILDFTSLHVQEDDGLPSQICAVCRTLLDAFHMFKNKCITSDQTLRVYLRKMDPNFEVKSESDENVAEDAEDLEQSEDTSDDVVTTEPSTHSSRSPDSQWSCEAVEQSEDTSDDVVTTEPSTHSSRSPHSQWSCEAVEQSEDTSDDVVTTEPSTHSSRSPDSQWSCEAVDIEVKVEITEPDSENTNAPRKRKYRRIDDGNTLIQALYPCSHCDKKFFHKNSLTRHKFAHSDEKFECMYCKKALSTRETLIRHVKAHIGQKAYTCALCEKQYTSNTSYLAHIRKHTGERPYKCGECNESFSLTSSLARHIAKKHKQEKSFVCDLCGAAFWVYDDLRSHVNRVH